MNFNTHNKRRGFGMKTMFGGGCLMMILSVILNFAFWGGLIYFVFWCLQNFGII